MDFLFDNIGFFALLLYAAVVFVSKIAMGGKAEDEPQQPPRQRRPQPRSPHDFPRPMPRRAPATDPFEEGDFSDAQTRREIVNDSRNNAKPDHSPAAPCNQYAPEEPGETEYAPDITAARRLVEQMTADSHSFHGGNSYINTDLFELENYAEEADTPEEHSAPEEPGETEYAPDEPPSADKTKTAAEEYGLNTAGALRRAFVASEILGKPKSLRKDEL